MSDLGNCKIVVQSLYVMHMWVCLKLTGNLYKLTQHLKLILQVAIFFSSKHTLSSNQLIFTRGKALLRQTFSLHIFTSFKCEVLEKNQVMIYKKKSFMLMYSLIYSENPNVTCTDLFHILSWRKEFQLELEEKKYIYIISPPPFKINNITNSLGVENVKLQYRDMNYCYSISCRQQLLPKPGPQPSAICSTVCTINSYSTLLNWPIVSLLILLVLFSNVFVF